MQKWICICFSFLLLGAANTAIAETQCSLTGEWHLLYDPTPIELQQNGTTVTSLHPLSIPDCGERILEGTNENNHFHLKWYYPNPKPRTKNPACEYWSELDGTFAANNCLSISGDMTNHMLIDDKPYQYAQPFSWWRNQFLILSPDPLKELIISAEPKMPSFIAIAKMVTGDQLNAIKSIRGGKFPYKWKVKIDNLPCHWRFETELDEVSTELPTFTPDFNLLKFDNNLVDGGIFGGQLTLSVSYYDSFSDSKTYSIKGTNPGKLRIEAVLYQSILRQIACQESKYKQFEADSEGGVGEPLVGGQFKKGGVGIMQLCEPKPKVHQIWNWRNNLQGGIELNETKRKEALTIVKNELKRVNKYREEENQHRTVKLKACESLPSLTEEQLQRETLRRYNGGREHRFEPADDPDCKGKWVINPTVEEDNDLDYVNHVLNCKLK